MSACSVLVQSSNLSRGINAHSLRGSRPRRGEGAKRTVRVQEPVSACGIGVYFCDLSRGVDAFGLGISRPWWGDSGNGSVRV